MVEHPGLIRRYCRGDLLRLHSELEQDALVCYTSPGLSPSCAARRDWHPLGGVRWC